MAIITPIVSATAALIGAFGGTAFSERLKRTTARQQWERDRIEPLANEFAELGINLCVSAVELIVDDRSSAISEERIEAWKSETCLLMDVGNKLIRVAPIYIATPVMDLHLEFLKEFDRARRMEDLEQATNIFFRDMQLKVHRLTTQIRLYMTTGKPYSSWNPLRSVKRRMRTSRRRIQRIDTRTRPTSVS